MSLVFMVLSPRGLWLGEVVRLARRRLGRRFDRPVFKRVTRATSTLNLRYCIMNNCIHSVFLRHPSGSVSMMIMNDKVTVTRTLKGHLKHNTRISIFGGFKATRMGCGNARMRFMKTHGRSCRQSSQGPVIRSKALRSSRGHHSFAVGTLTIYLGGTHFKRLMSPFNNVRSVGRGAVHAPLSPSVAFDSSPLHVVHYVHFTARLGFCVSSSAFRSLYHGERQVGVVSHRHVTSRLGGVVLSPIPSGNFVSLRHDKLLSLVFPRLTTLRKMRAQGNHSRGSGFCRALRMLSGVDGGASGL